MTAMRRVAALLLPLIAQADLPLWTEGKKVAKNPILAADSFTKVMRKAGPAVVSIIATPKARENPTPQNEPVGQALGAGFFIRSDGLLITNQHVVANAHHVEIRLVDDRRFTVEIVGWDKKTDLALLRVIEGSSTTPFPIILWGDSERLQIGEWVVAIGNPLALEQTLTAGIVSAKGRHDLRVEDIAYQDFIQTDASINPGNSGGPLLNLRGEAVGVLTAVNRGGQGIGFASSIQLARAILPRLYRDGQVRRSWMGVVVEPGDLTHELARAFRLPHRQGALIAEIVAGSPASEAGLKSGDVVVRFGGHEIVRTQELSWWVSLAEVGHEVELVVLREGKEQRLRVTPRAMSDADAPPPRSQQTAVLGMEVAEINARWARELALGVSSGVAVTKVLPGTAADRAGVTVGDSILEVNGHPVQTVDEYFEAVRNVPKGETIRLHLRRKDGQLHWAAFLKG